MSDDLETQIRRWAEANDRPIPIESVRQSRGDAVPTDAGRPGRSRGRRAGIVLAGCAAGVVAVLLVSGLSGNRPSQQRVAPTAAALQQVLDGAGGGVQAIDKVEDLMHNTTRQVTYDGAEAPFAPHIVFVRADITAVEGWFSYFAEPRDDGNVHADDLRPVAFDGTYGVARVRLDVRHDFDDPAPAPEWMWVSVPDGELEELAAILVAVDDAVIVGVRGAPPSRFVEEDAVQLGPINPITADGRIDWAYPENTTDRVPNISDIEGYGASKGEVVIVADEGSPPTVIERRPRD